MATLIELINSRSYPFEWSAISQFDVDWLVRSSSLSLIFLCRFQMRRELNDSSCALGLTKPHIDGH